MGFLFDMNIDLDKRDALLENDYEDANECIGNAFSRCQDYGNEETISLLC